MYRRDCSWHAWQQCLVHILFLMLTAMLKNILHLDVIERATVIYSNAGILVIPLVQELTWAGICYLFQRVYCSTADI